MNPYEPPQTINVTPRKPVKRFSMVMVILIVTLVGVGMFGLEVLHSYIAVGRERQQANEQLLLQQRLRANQETGFRVP